MVQRVSIELFCDFCESAGEAGAATETLQISVSGPVYTVDVCDEHAKTLYELRDTIHRVGRTERVGVRKEKPRPWNPGTKDAKRRRTQQLQEVRTWLRANGHPVGNARVPYELQRVYNEAHPDAPVTLADGGRGPSSRSVGDVTN